MARATIDRLIVNSPYEKNPRRDRQAGLNRRCDPADYNSGTTIA